MYIIQGPTGQKGEIGDRGERVSCYDNHFQCNIDHINDKKLFCLVSTPSLVFCVARDKLVVKEEQVSQATLVIR